MMTEPHAMQTGQPVHPVQAATHAFVGAFLEELERSGLRHVVICPGSRSTPLALLSMEHEGLKVWMHIDERSAGYFALGLAKATGDPVALIATSGTAIANFLPAVTEAFFGRVPLLLLTADRPPELRDVGGNQTIYQAGMFGDHVKWSVDLPVPEASESLGAYARATAARALATARAAPAGPVQLNFPLREPLVPLSGHVGAADGALFKAGAADVWHGSRALADEQIKALATELGRSRRTLIVCGPDTPEDAWQPVLQLAERLGSPVLADPLSGLRTTGRGTRELIDAYDVFLRFQSVMYAVPPSLVLRLGAMPVSKPLLQYLQHYRDTPQIVVDEGGGWRDPIAAARRFIYASPARLCVDVLRELDGEAEVSAPRRANPWPLVWRRLNDVTREQLDEQLQSLAEPFEGLVFDMLAGLPLDGVNFYVGNSMPIRDLDAFFPAGEQRLRLFGNRGVSGIDGVVSGALGVSAADTGPTLLILGDLSFYHDLNGLLAAYLHKLNVTIVVINNDGGGIFSFLPQAQHGRYFEELFGTPTGLDFAPVVGMYGGRFTRTSDIGQLRDEVASSLPKLGLDVIEYATNRQQNAALHHKIVAAAGQALTEQLSSIFRGAGGGR